MPYTESMDNGRRVFSLENTIRKWLAAGLVFVLIVIAGVTPIGADEETLKDSDFHAASAVVMEAETGRILYEKNGNEQRAMASTTKIMTLLVALEYGDFETPVAVSANAASQPKVHMNMKEGETFRLMDLLYALMLVSYNDAAVAVAEAVAGDVESFCYLMNLKARELGAYQTHFSTPNGLDAADHYSTAVDMALIGRAAINDETAMQIMQTRSYTIQQDEVNSRSVQLGNKNPLLSSYTAAIGGKTGYTNEAGLCLVGMAERDDVQLISVVLGSGWPPHSNYRVADSLKLFEYGFNEFRHETIWTDWLDEHPIVEVSGGFADSVSTRLEGSLDYYMKESDSVSLFYDLPYVVEAPIVEGQVLGQAAVCIDGKAVGYLDVVACESAEEKTFRRVLWNVCKSIWPSVDAGLAENVKNGLRQVL